ncbi:MAG: DUF1292 domain-containing protein [Bacilli bacterium]|nr:DUF1292 domain-containing protein [Bacilli bacterium]
MIEDIMTSVIELEGKDYFLVSEINNYVYYAEEANPKNFIILKEIIDDDEEYIVSLDDDKEYDKALALFYERYGEANV